jgi:hypothetical protein
LTLESNTQEPAVAGRQLIINGLVKLGNIAQKIELMNHQAKCGVLPDRIPARLFGPNLHNCGLHRVDDGDRIAGAILNCQCVFVSLCHFISPQLS